MNYNETLPTHPYSYQAMKTAIEYAKLAGASQYRDPNNHKLPPVNIKMVDGELRFSSDATLEHYLPFHSRDEIYPIGKPGFMHGLFDKKECSFGEFFINELYQQPFHVKNKETGELSVAVKTELAIKGSEMGFTLVGENKVVESLSELSKKYDITPISSNLVDFKPEIPKLSDQQFWGLMTTLNWKADHNPYRCKKMLLDKYDVKIISAIQNKMYEKSRDIYHKLSSVEKSSGERFGEDRISALADHLTSHGKHAYDMIMTSSDEHILKVLQQAVVAKSIQLPMIQQHTSYPYALYSVSGDQHEINLSHDSSVPDTRKLNISASAISAIHAIKSIDFDHVTPARVKQMAPVYAEALDRLSKIVEGDLKGACQNFGVKEYNRLSNMQECNLHAYVPNIIINLLEAEGVDYKKVIVEPQQEKTEKKSAAYANDGPSM